MATSATTDLRFRLLGPLGGSVKDGEPLHLGGERQRGLLALLLLHANELVTTEQLVEQLFGADASDASVRAVRVAVSRLRRLLDDETLVDASRRLRHLRRPEPARRRRVRSARHRRPCRARSRGSRRSAGASFRSALALFRGPPLADLALLDFVQPESATARGAASRRARWTGSTPDLALGRGVRARPRARGARSAEPVPGAAARPADARALPLRATERRARGVPANARGVSRTSSASSRAARCSSSSARCSSTIRRSTCPSARAAVEPAVCPFKGLAAFEAADAYVLLRTRAAALAELIARLGVGHVRRHRRAVRRRQVVAPPCGRAAGARRGCAARKRRVARRARAPRSGRSAKRCEAGERVVIAVDQLEEIFADEVSARGSHGVSRRARARGRRSGAARARPGHGQRGLLRALRRLSRASPTGSARARCSCVALDREELDARDRSACRPGGARARALARRCARRRLSRWRRRAAAAPDHTAPALGCTRWAR